VWERALADPPGRRAVRLLAAVFPETPLDALAAISIGRRDSHLLTLHEQTFGPKLTAIANCPACDQRVESAFTAQDVRCPDPGRQPDSLTLSVDGWEIVFRLPDTLDLLAVEEHARDVEAGRSLLLARTILRAGRGGLPSDAAALPAEIAGAVAGAMEEADPQGSVEVVLNCPGCGHKWEALFDIASFFWRGLDNWALRTLREVHVLASAYGWSEGQILSLSPWRRQAYMSLVNA